MKRPILMALGKRKLKQDELFIPTAKPATGPGHPLYRKFNQVPCEGHARRPLSLRKKTTSGPARTDFAAGNYAGAVEDFRSEFLMSWLDSIDRQKRLNNQVSFNLFH